MDSCSNAEHLMKILNQGTFSLSTRSRTNSYTVFFQAKGSVKPKDGLCLFRESVLSYVTNMGYV